jgi:IMP cyclohydrolase
VWIRLRLLWAHIVCFMLSLAEVLAVRSYPGRGCLAARSNDGTLGFVYFLTGRSQASRARELVVVDGGDIAVRGRSGDSHDSLRHYVAGARRGSWVVVGNGGQVVPVAEALQAGRAVPDAWRQHSYEPDSPIFTPRIWLVHNHDARTDAIVGYVRRGREGAGADHVAWAAETVEPGTGILMTTYAGTEAEVVTTTAPEDVRVRAASVTELLAEVWTELRRELRVGAFAVTPETYSWEPIVIQ